MIQKFFTIIFLISSFSLISNQGFSTPAETTSKNVFFKNLKDNQKVPSTFKVEMGVKGMEVKNAGQELENKTAGHHHIIIDGAFVPEGQVIPSDDKHLHFGKGQMEATLKLTPGIHTITLQFADGNHKSYGEALSATVKVNVQ